MAMRYRIRRPQPVFDITGSPKMLAVQGESYVKGMPKAGGLLKFDFASRAPGTDAQQSPRGGWLGRAGRAGNVFSKPLLAYANKGRGVYAVCGPMEAPSGFDVNKLHAMIEAGEPPPDHWRPYLQVLVHALVYSDTSLPAPWRRHVYALSLVSFESFRPLIGLCNLRYLWAQSPVSGDLGPLAGLENLEQLYILRNEAISDLRPLSGCRQLLDLHIGSTSVANLAPLSEATRLRELSLSHTKVRDLTPLAGMVDLEDLSLVGTPVESIAPLMPLAKLRRIRLARSAVRDLSPLAQLGSLSRIDLSEDLAIDSLSPLAALSNVQEINLGSRSEDDARRLWASLPKRDWLAGYHYPGDCYVLARREVYERLLDDRDGEDPEYTCKAADMELRDWA